MLYGGSIIFGRGLEYLVLLFAASYLTKDLYGNLEFYKKVIELGATFLAFGFPTLILSYTKSRESKFHFTLIALVFILVLSLVLIPILYGFGYLILLVPICFSALFFNNGIVPPFILVSYGSNHASYYKMLISGLFFAVTFALLFSAQPDYSFVYVGYVLLPIMLIFAAVKTRKEHLIKRKMYRYWKLFKGLLLKSFTLVISNFSNMMFLYTDILIIKLLSATPNIEIANYSFSLNIANALILVPLTLVQVDIEKLKKKKGFLKQLNKKITGLTGLAAIVIVGLFLLLINTFFEDYKNTLLIFSIMILAKLFQCFSVSYGATAIIKKLYNTNLIINLSMLTLNIILSYGLYLSMGITGVAVASAASLLTRYLLLMTIIKNAK